MTRQSQKLYKFLFEFGAWHNFIGGVLILCLYSYIYTSAGLPVANLHYQEWIGLIFVFGIASYLIAKDMFGNKNLILVCILGKAASAAPMMYALLFHYSTTPPLFIIPAITDSTIGILFLVFYVQASRQKLWQ